MLKPQFFFGLHRLSDLRWIFGSTTLFPLAFFIETRFFVFLYLLNFQKKNQVKSLKNDEVATVPTVVEQPNLILPRASEIQRLENILSLPESVFSLVFTLEIQTERKKEGGSRVLLLSYYSTFFRLPRRSVRVPLRETSFLIW